MKDEKDWSKASDDELIAEAKRRYPAGTDIIPLNLDFMGQPANTVMKVALTDHHVAPAIPKEGVWVSVTDGFNAIVFKNGKWAEIINEPKEASPESQKEFEASNPGMIFKPEPKAGDMVEWSIHGDKGWSLAEYHGKTKSGKHVVSSAEVAAVVDHVRLPQKSEVESKVDELYKKWERGDLMGYDALRSICIWGQQNPTKK